MKVVNQRILGEPLAGVDLDMRIVDAVVRTWFGADL